MKKRESLARQQEGESTFLSPPVLYRQPAIQQQTVDAAPDLVEEVLSSDGQPLDEGTREFMEPRFGHDFSRVRVHTDERAARSARAVNASAYTAGESIVFDRGHYSPGTSMGRYLLAHELAHVVQQSAGPVAGTSVGEGVSVSEPHDSFELAADETAKKVLGSEVATDPRQNLLFSSGSTTPLQRYSASTGHRTLQRFQAGDTGHGGIEQKALVDAGFSQDDAGKVYLGNWLRDLSQMPPAALPLINILCLGEFGREVSQSDLGTYVPSEHLDNPEGGGTVEDPTITDDQYAEKIKNLSPEQRKAYDEEQANKSKIAKAADDSGLPLYIERGKFHAKRELENAIRTGKTPEGMQAMGNALHAVEDYFSHSNFIEVAIWNLLQEGSITKAQYHNLVTTDLGNDAAKMGGEWNPKDPKNSPHPEIQQPGIITGTYASGGNDWVSRLELLTSEVEHGQLTKAFVKGAVIKLGITTEEIVKKAAQMGGSGGVAVGGAIGGTIGGAVGGVTGGIAGAGKGAAEGWRTHSGLSAVWHGFTGLFSGAAQGAAEGASEGWDAGKDVGSAAGGAVGTVAGGLVGVLAGASIDVVLATLGIATVLLLLPVILPLMMSLITAVKTGVIDKVVQGQTERADREAKKAGIGPTHAEIAKDSPHHELFTIGIALAQQVDQEVGRAMLSAWEEKAKRADPPNTPSPDLEEPITNLVDKYVSHPAQDKSWWHDIVLAGAMKAVK